MNCVRIGAVASALFASLVVGSAITLNVGLVDPYAIGDVVHGLQGGGGQVARDVTMINNLLTVAPGTAAPIGNSGPPPSTSTYYRTANLFGSLPTAAAAGAQFASGIANGPTYLDITLSSSFTYLLAAYDGPNGGVQVWNIASFAPGTTLSIPRYAEPSGADGTGPLVQSSRYLMTGWSLLNPGEPIISVPDGGPTALLLGSALVALALIRRPRQA